MNEITTKSYWESYYSETSANSEQIKRICRPYDLYWEAMVTACSKTPKSIIEIGAYPGRYLAYLASKYGLHPTALDYNSDKSKIKAAFRAMGIDDYEIIQEDFLTFDSDKQYDLVVSIGFIEHFNNYNEVLDKHANLLAPGGSMVVMIPNKRFFRKYYGILCDYSNLKAHNLKCMRLTVFEEFAKRNELEVVHLDYWGGFPYSVHQTLNFGQKIIYKGTRLFFKKLNPIIARFPNKFLSSTIIGVFHKPLK